MDARWEFESLGCWGLLHGLVLIFWVIAMHILDLGQASISNISEFVTVTRNRCRH